MSDLPERLSLREVGPRDGLQNEDPVPTAAKVALIDALSATGVGAHRGGVVRAPEGDPADGRRRRGVGRDHAATRTSATRRWCRTCAAPSGRSAAGFREIEVVVSASDTHNRKNLNRSTDESLDDIAAHRRPGARRRARPAR